MCTLCFQLLIFAKEMEEEGAAGVLFEYFPHFFAAVAVK